jgi:hypothetical protein
MGEPTNEAVLRAYLTALTENDAATMERLRHPGWTSDYPQSGERIRGHANERAIADNYPGGLPTIEPPKRVVGSEDKWVVTPSFTFERVAGSGDAWWTGGRATYPSGATWYVATLYEFRNGLVHREITYWAEPFEPPAWRAQWVEPIDEG